jgi:hypothetical protein
MDHALDVSNYSGVFGAEAVACWRALGYQHLVCGTQRPEITHRQLEAALGGGMTVDAYVYLYWRFAIAEQVRAAFDTIAGVNVGRLWLDCEDAPGGRPPHEIVDLISQAASACGQFPHGIYTGRWWWEPNTANSTAFSHLPLWHAEYTPAPSVLPDFAAFQGYGGWTRPLMWQYQGTTQVCGISVDLNLRDAPAPEPLPPPPDLQVTIAEREELASLRAGQQFLRAFATGRYVFQSLADRTGVVELRWVWDGVHHPFDPPCIIEVD